MRERLSAETPDGFNLLIVQITALVSFETSEKIPGKCVCS